MLLVEFDFLFGGKRLNPFVVRQLVGQLELDEPISCHFDSLRRECACFCVCMFKRVEEAKPKPVA